MENDFIQNNIRPLLTINELAKFLNISKTTAYRLVEKQSLPFYKIGGVLRFKLSEVELYMEKCLVKSSNEIYGNIQET